MKINVQAVYDAHKAEMLAKVAALPEDQRADLPTTPEMFDEYFAAQRQNVQARRLFELVARERRARKKANAAARAALRKRK